MGDLKPISHKQFDEFIKGKGFNPISPGRFNTFSTWGGEDSAPLRNFAFLTPN